MFTQCVFLLAVIVPVLSDFTIHQESYQRDCIDVTCPKNAIKDVAHPLVKDNLEEAKCTICSQCTDYGFSVCAQARPNALRFKRNLDNYSCACANSVPEGCKITQRSSTKRDPNTEVYSICYLSTLRTPPKPLALNQEKEVIATLEPFWLESYWKEFQLSNLTLFFEFEVKSPELCDEIGNVTTNEGADPPYTCMSSLQMEMTGEPIPDGTAKKDYDPTDFFSQTDDIEYDDEDDAPPEVEFARNVFAEAKHVKLWYTVVVKRPRQLNLLKGEQKIHDVTTVLSSESLKFDLQPEVYGDGNSGKIVGKEDKDDKGHDNVNIVNIADKDDESSEMDDNEIDPDKLDEELDEKDPIDDGTNDIKETDDDDDEEEEDDNKLKEDEEDDDDTDDDNDEDADDEDQDDETEETDVTEEATTPEADETTDDDDNEISEENTDGTDKPSSTESTDESATTGDEEEGDETDEEKSDEILDSMNGNDTSIFLPIHFGNWPLVQVGMILALIACLLIIAAACCYKYRGCCCYSDQQKIVTKTSNGYEYHVTGQTGQEMKSMTKDINEGLIPPPSSSNQLTTHVDENVLDATIRELQGIAESANIGQVQNTHNIGNTSEETQQLIEPETDNQELQDFQELMRISPRLWPYRLRIDALVGNGHFGNIHKGLLIDSTRNTAQDVAVFSVKKFEQANEKEIRTILNTFAETVKAGAHPNIISLLAVQQQPDRLLVVLDSLFYPDLLTMLRESRITRYDTRLQKKTASMINSDILISMMVNCAYGCGHLIRHGITHPMLSTINVLVVGRTLAKISGFGFANHRLLHQKQFESRPQKQRWLAPEYFVREYASPTCGQSNIWSLGVLLWEIASLGGTPYSQYPTQEAFQERMREKTAKLQHLSYCSEDLMSIIYQCCTYDRDSRPDMTDVIARKLEQISIDPESHIDISVKGNEFNYSPVIANLEQITAHL